ncbi:MAG TPA: hydrogenase maturation nickel metallochaperone HypA [Candidatus Baltobacteraceae bacterium]|nr:hydrogenase maturation nickel metallochaperone HypA [Candidatus Baltobacteraceae bacterium]
MHELALSQSIVDLVLGCTRTEGIRTVTRVVVEIGAAAGVDPTALQFCFDVVVEETVAHGAEPVIAAVLLRARFRNCLHEFEPIGMLAPCPACGRLGAHLLQGRELRVKSFDGE